MSKINKKKFKDNTTVESGFFEDGLPFARIGNKPNIIVNIETLSFKHEPPTGIMLKQFAKSTNAFLEKFSCYLVGRKQNVPENYTFADMAKDYATMIKREFKKPVIIMGVSTGGQIAHYIAADHPDVVQKLIIISAAYRLSERGVEIERRAGEYFQQKKYGKSLAAILDLLYTFRIKRLIAKFFTRLVGKWFIGKIKYPNDFLTEIRGDREMNFKDRLKEIKAPTLILSGETDIGYDVGDVRATAEGIPNTQLIIYEGYGHSLSMANRKKLQEDILKFLNKD